MNSVRWGLTTFVLGITTGTLGYYLRDPGEAAGSILVISVMFAFIGAAGVAGIAGE